MQVGECTLYTRLPRERFTEQPVPHQVTNSTPTTPSTLEPSLQVLVESTTFPKLWERDLLLRQFFSQFGQVDALDWVGDWRAGGVKLIVSFKVIQDISSAIVGIWSQ